jgi:hypothetical protein
MNFGKKGPYILIALLVIILIFILGVQYGKRVKIADTAISFLLSITPSPSPKPSRIPVVKYNSYSHKGCSISFLHPSYLQVEKESTQEAQLSSKDKNQFIKLNCSKKLSEKKDGSDSASITVNGYTGKSFDEIMKLNGDSINIKIIQINRAALPVELIFNKELEPLITTSIKLQ